MNTGKVKWFNGSGYKSLEEGQKVSYDVENDERSGKTRAVNVTVL